jgi:hypothetical protein
MALGRLEATSIFPSFLADIDQPYVDRSNFAYSII